MKATNKQNKKLELLVVEDTPFHLEEAKSEMENLVKYGAQISVDYATTLKEAMDLQKHKKYDGIITDMFFPYDDQTRDDNIKGWDYETSAKCAKEIVPYLKKNSEIIKNTKEWNDGAKERDEKRGYKTNSMSDEELLEDISERLERNEKVNQAHYDYISGKSMHPSGMIVAMKALKEGTPVRYCTDARGHGSVTNAIDEATSNLANTLREKNPNSVIYENKLGYGGILTETKKDWLTTYYKVVTEIILSKNKDYIEEALYSENLSEKNELYKKWASIAKDYLVQYYSWNDFPDLENAGFDLSYIKELNDLAIKAREKK